MDVTCEKCRTEYEFDESLISESGTTVKCTSCGHLFRIFAPGTPESSRLSSWLLRQPDGSVYTFERLATLQRWIAEGKATQSDVVSRTGDGWKSLGDIAELAPFFDIGHGWDVNETLGQNQIESAGIGLRYAFRSRFQAWFYWGYGFSDFPKTDSNIQDNGFHIGVTYRAF